MSDYIRVTMAPDSLQVNPGEAAEAVITVQNASNVVDLFLIEVKGLDPSWFKLSVPNASLMPRDEGNSTLTITPPKASASIANDYPFTVKISSQKDSTQETIVSGNLGVQPYYSYSLDLHPQRATGARGFYTLSITNESNAELAFNLTGRDPEDLCQFFFDRHPRVPPGETAEVDLMVQPGQRPLRGRPKLYSFTLTVTPEHQAVEPATVPGGLEVTPRIGEGLRRVVGILLRRPRAVPNVQRRMATALRRGAVGGREPIPPPPKPFPWLIPAVLAALVVAAVVLVVVFLVLIPRGGRTSEGAFLLNPGEDISFGVPFPDATPVKIRATAKWQGTAGVLAVTLHQPGGASDSKPLDVTQSAPWVDFEVKADLITKRGVEGWAVNLKNTSAGGQAEGTLKLSFSKLE